MANIRHSIRASLYKNKFTEDPDHYTARAVTENLLKIQDICQSAVTRGGVDASPSTMQYLVELFFKEMIYQLCDGHSVDNGYFTLKPSIKGVFKSPDEKFNPEKHHIRLLFTESKKLRKILSDTELKILGLAKSNLYITQVTDIKTRLANQQLTPKYSLKITGNMIKIAGEHPDVGVYFINEDTAERTKVDTTDIVKNLRSSLFVMIPVLDAGDYRLQIITQYTTSGTLKQPRSTTFEHILRVHQ